MFMVLSIWIWTDTKIKKHSCNVELILFFILLCVKLNVLLDFLHNDKISHIIFCKKTNLQSR